MFGKPTIADELITAAGRDAYGLAIRSLEFLPIGWDSRAWVYRAEATTGDSYFLKLRQWPVAEAGIAVPRYLEDHGIGASELSRARPAARMDAARADPGAHSWDRP